MPIPRAAALIESYGTTTWLIHYFTDQLTHEESLLQPPFAANCLNWVVGHIVCGRNIALKVLGMQDIWPAETVERYRTGSEPICGPEGAVPLPDLLADLDEAGSRIAAALADIDESGLERLAETERGVKSVYDHLSGLHWHETYHTGQVELLRALALGQRRP